MLPVFFISQRERNAKQQCKNLHLCYDVSRVRLATWGPFLESPDN